MQSELDRIHDAIDDGAASIRDALAMANHRLYESDDDDERRELQRIVRALGEGLVALGDARHRANVQRKLVPEPISPIPYTPPVQPWQPYPGTTPRPTFPWGPTIICGDTTVDSGSVASALVADWRTVPDWAIGGNA